MAFCTQCGSSNLDGARFCGSCGTSLPVQPVAYVVPPVQPVIPVAPAYVVVRAPKSVGVAILLTVFFGPLGMLYSTVPGALVMMAVSILLAIVTAGLSVFLTWPICVIWGAMAADAYNKGRA